MPRQLDPAKENTTPRTKRFLYKRAEFSTQPAHRTLEELLNEAWDRTAILRNRRQTVDEDANTCLVTTYRTQVHGMAFFEVIFFTPGMKALAAKLDLDQASLDPAEVDVKDDQGAKLDLIEHMLHFGVKENHVIILQSLAVDSVLLEGHLNWLLAAAGIEMIAGQRVNLSNRLPPDREAAIETAKSVIFDTEIPTTTVPGQNGHQTIRPVGGRWEGFKRILTDLGLANVAHDLELQGLQQASPIDVRIRLGWRRRKGESGHTMLNKVATGLRHVDDQVTYKIETAHGSLTNTDFILRKPKTVHCRGERPVRDLLHKTISDWLLELLRAQEI